MSINITYANETTSEMFVNGTSLNQDDCLCVCDRLIKCDNNTSGYFDFATSISDLSEVCENVVFLAIVLILRLSSQRRICKRKDLSVKHLQQRIPKKYWNHNLRSLLVLINCFFWCLYVGEVLIRWTYSERTNLGLLVLLAPITSLISTVFSLVLYGHLEHLAAHQLYLICPSLLWGVQILNSGARFYQVVCVYCVSITRAAPSLYTINSVIAFCLLIIDTTTIILWVAVDRRKQSVDLNPRRREPRSRKAKRRDPKSDQKQGVTPTASCFKKPQQRSPATPLEKKVVLIPSGEDEDEEVKFRGRRRRRISKDDVPSRLTYAHNESSFLSKCTFAWYVKLLRKGWKRPLEFSDFDKIPDEESSKHHHEKFQEAYNRMAKTSSSGEECLWKAFLLCYWPSFLFSGVLKLLGDTVNVVGPLAISPIVAFVRNIQEGTWELHGEIKNEMYFVGWLELLKNGWVLSVVAVVCSLLQSTFSQASTHLLAMAGIHVKTALQVMVYDKSLKMSVSASKRCLEKDGKLPPGGSQSLDAARVINLTWEDTCNIMTFFMHCHYVWAIPFKMCGLVALLWMQIGVSAVYAALIAVFLLVPLQFLLAKCIAAANTRVVEATDNRLALTHEVLALIRTVKTMALEVLFVRRVTDARKEELRHLLTDALLRAFMTFINQASGIVIILLAFGFYSFMEVEPLDEGVIFSSLALFNQLTVPLFILPLIVAYSIKAKRSVSRFREFFAEAEVSPRKFVASEEGTAEASENGDQEQKQILTVENGAFSYDRERKEVVLTNITTSIPRGKLTVILGGVGSGKTSFLLSLLGELPMTSGILNWKRSGSVAFVSQTPWLVNCTLKENILMGKTLQNRKYKRIIDVCALQPDIDLLPDGDDTEIGEKGINLSGGQRQRVALARALYSDLPVVLMDCPFSALDATVAQQVSRQVREEHLRKGLSSTLVIATQHNTLAVFADKVIYLEDKTIKCQGSPEEISQCHPDLWSDWTGSSSHLFPSIGEVLAGKNREKCSLWKERNYLYRHLTRISRITRKGKGQNNLADEDFNLPLLRSPLGHHFSLVRTSPLQILLPSNEMDYLPSVVFAKKKSRPPKSSVFRTISSSPTFGRSTGHNINFPLDRRFAKSLPPRPCRSRTCSRNTDDGNYKLTREDSVLKTFFASSKNKGVQTKPSKVRWNSRILSLLSRKDGSESESVEEEEDGGGVESDDTGVYDALIDDEERERGRISRWNYVAYLKACGWPAGTLFLLFLLLNQGLLISLDVWLGHWSKMCDEGNCSPANCSEGSPLEANSSFVLWNSNQTLLPGNGSDCEEVNLEISSYLLTFGLLSGFAVLSGLLTICLAQLAAHRGRRTLHENMLSAVVGTKGKFFDLNPIGRIINRFSSDVSLIDKDLGWALMHFLYFALLCSSAMLVNALISPIFIVVSVPICLVYYILQHVFRCSSRELKRLESLSRSPVMGLIAETADFPCVVRAYGIQARFFSCYFRRLDSHLESYVLFHTGNRWLGICLDYMGGVVVFMSTVACLFGSTAIEWYLLSPLTVGLAIKYTLAIPVYLNWLVRFFSDTEMCLNAVERVQQYGRLSPEVDIEQDITNTTNQVVCCSKKKCKCRDTMRSFRTSFMRTLQLDNDSACNSVNASSDHLVFENVKIFYDKNSDAVLSGVSFKVPAGQKVGVCGRTGSGKSSLLMGIVRMAEHQEGRILIDGVDVRSVRLSPLRKGISVVPQELNIFRDSVRFNMDPEKKYTDESLWNALELVKLKDFVADLPQKLETQLLGSSTLSAGQRQLLVLSRVLLEKRPLVLLDEFTSNLDSQMERYLLTMLQQQLPHSTIIFIAHSIMSLMSCDRVLSIDEGKLVEDGSPSELSQRSHGVFVSLLHSAGREGAPEGYPTHWLSQSSSVGIEVQEIEDQNSS